MSDKRYLDKHGNQWRVQVRIPPKLQPVIGKKKLIHPLHTDSLANANRLKWDVVARLKAQIRAAEKGSDSSADPLTAEAMSWRADIEREKPPVIEVQDAETGEPIEVDSPVLPDLLLERAQEIAEAHGPDKAEVFYKAAIGQATPVTALIDPWLTERADMKERQRKDYRRAVEKFAAWSTVAIEGVTRKVAGRYVSEEMVQKGKHPKTANKDISCLSSYWRWLIKRGHVEANPWLNQSLSKKLAPKITKRPFTDDEVSRLIGGTRNLFLLDLMQMGALSGMRLEEIASLSVADVADKEFNILDAKTKAGIRTLPIHSALLPIIKRRVKSKKPSDFLFEEMGDARDGAQERGQIGTKRFITYRRSLGVEEKSEGQRQSNVDFHSFRRWFIAKARNALQRGAKGFDPWTIAEIVGHDTKSGDGDLKMTMGVYPGPQTVAAKRACVDSVKLPKV